MNLVKLMLFPCAALLAAVLVSGCKSTDGGPDLTDNPNAPTATKGVPEVTEAARFEAGETVTVASSTGSEIQMGPIAAAGQSFLIAEDGTITLPIIGKIVAKDKTPGELQDDITKLYVPAYFTSLAITVTAQYRVYSVGGEVGHPGPEVYNGETTVTKAIQAAGDFTQFASHTVWLTRKDGTRIQVKVNNALSDPTQDPQVFPGDEIYVPRRYF